MFTKDLSSHFLDYFEKTVKPFVVVAHINPLAKTIRVFYSRGCWSSSLLLNAFLISGAADHICMPTVIPFKVREPEDTALKIIGVPALPGEFGDLELRNLSAQPPVTVFYLI